MTSSVTSSARPSTAPPSIIDVLKNRFRLVRSGDRRYRRSNFVLGLGFVCFVCLFALFFQNPSIGIRLSTIVILMVIVIVIDASWWHVRWINEALIPSFFFIQFSSANDFCLQNKQTSERKKNWANPTKFYWVLLCFTGFYWVSKGFVRFHKRFTGFHRILLDLTGFLLGFTGFYNILLGFTGFYWVLQNFYWVLLGFPGFYWFFKVILSFQGCYWVLLGF